MFIITIVAIGFLWTPANQSMRPNCGKNCNLNYVKSCRGRKGGCDQSQHNEDRYVLKHFFNNDRYNRTFIEMGALNGIGLSNTLQLELLYGWSGE